MQEKCRKNAGKKKIRDKGRRGVAERAKQRAGRCGGANPHFSRAEPCHFAIARTRASVDGRHRAGRTGRNGRHGHRADKKANEKRAKQTRHKHCSLLASRNYRDSANYVIMRLQTAAAPRRPHPRATSTFSACCIPIHRPWPGYIINCITHGSSAILYSRFGTCVAPLLLLHCTLYCTYYTVLYWVH